MVEGRSLVPSEEAMELFNRHSGSLNIVIISHLQGAIDEVILRKSLDILQSNYPCLNWCIAGSLSSLRFTHEGTKQIPLRVVNKTSYQCWQNVVTEELNTKTASEECLIRYTLWQNDQETDSYYLISTIHHGIADGLSALQLQVELLEIYKKIALGLSFKVKQNSLNFPVITDLLPKYLQGYRGFLRSALFLLKLKLKMLWVQPESLKSEVKVPPQLRSCIMTQRCLNPVLTKKLVKLSKKNQATVQSALCSAMSMATAKKISQGEKRNINVSCQSYVDLRSRAEPIISLNAMGILVSFINSLHTLTPHKSFWDLAQEINREIKLALSRQDYFKPLRLINKACAYYLYNLDGLYLTTSITNVGKLNVPQQYGNLELKAISFLPSNVVFGRVITLAVTTFQDKMLLNFVASQPSISQETLETLAEDVIQILTM